MANYLTTDSELSSIADAIRAKGGTSAQLSYPTEFVSAIDAIPTGGGAPSSEKQVCFIDYDGTLLYSYTAEEANALTSLPANPSHTGLVAQGWNWTLTEIKTQLTNAPDGDIVIGQMYTTSSGKTEIDISLDDGRLSPILCIKINGTVSVDWGDGSEIETETGNSLTTFVYMPHTYSSSGSYTISIGVVSGEFTFAGDSDTTPLLRRSATANDNYVYRNAVKFVRIGNGITSIGGSGFYKYYSLKYLTLPSAITDIGSSFCHTCYSLKALIFPHGIARISNDCPSCYALLYASVPCGITTIGSDTFTNCVSLQKATIPYTVTDVGVTPFNYCYFKKIVYPSGCTYISSLQYCYSLETVVLPPTITAIPNSFLSYGRQIKSFSVPTNVTSIGNSAFGNCYTLREVSMSDEVTSIGASAFNNCYSLSSLKISNALTTIGASAFNNCYSLPSITIPATVTSIGNYAFRYCYSLKECHMKPTSPPTVGTTSFANTASDLVIYVPYSADHSILEAYKTASNWATYASKIQEEPS